MVTSNSVDEIIIDYTDCAYHQCLTPPEWRHKYTSFVPCVCSIQFNVEETFEKDVFLYYGLTNYFQGHRRYVKSYDLSQWKDGDLLKSVDDDCDPVDYTKKTNVTKRKPIAPCGFIANSLFNDTFQLYYMGRQNDSSKAIKVEMMQRDIAWSTDKNAKYKNPSNLTYAFDKHYGKPPNWHQSAAHLDPDLESNNGFLNERLMVWMRVAAFATFRKFYARIVHKDAFTHVLPKGRYFMKIAYSE